MKPYSKTCDKEGGNLMNLREETLNKNYDTCDVFFHGNKEQMVMVLVRKRKDSR